MLRWVVGVLITFSAILQTLMCNVVYIDNTCIYITIHCLSKGSQKSWMFFLRTLPNTYQNWETGDHMLIRLGKYVAQDKLMSQSSNETP